MIDDRPALIARLSLGIAGIPIIVEVVRAIATGWVPLFDAGYFTIRSRDVLTAHHPFIGAWSSGSARLDTQLRNIGPLQLDLLAPFTKLDPYWGTAVGVGVVGLASVFAVWLTAQRVLGPRAAVGAMLATLVVEAMIGSRAFIDPRQQLYLLLPFWALLWLTWALAIGQGWALAPTVFAASLIVQTHFTFVFQSMIVVAVGFGAFLIRHRGRWADATRPLVTGALVAIICWSQPLWDQVAGEGNLGAVLAGSDARPGVGLDVGAGIVAGSVLVPSSWQVDAMGAFDLPDDLVAGSATVAVLGVWTLLVVGAAAVAWRARNVAVAALVAMGGVALFAAAVAATQIPSSVFGLIAQNYFWMWPVGIFVATGVVAGLAVGFAAARPARADGARSRVMTSAVMVVAVAFAAIACRPVNNFANNAGELSAGSRFGRPLLDELAASLDELDVEGPLAIDLRRASFGTYVRYTLLAELQRAGIEFRFPPDDRNIERFGDDRCDDEGAIERLVLTDAGYGIRLERGEVLLADIDGLGADDRAELAELGQRFAGWLNDGTVGLDLEALRYLAGGDIAGLQEVLDSPTAPVDGLALALDGWRSWGAVRVPAELDEDFDRWVDLSARASLEVVAVILAPPERFSATRSRNDPTSCPS